jgi:hypothetical protein
LDGLWEVILDEGAEQDDIDSYFRIIAYLDETNVIERSLDSPSLLHAISWNSDANCSDQQIALSRRWMNFLKKEEYDFEQKDRRGRTPLLDHLSVDGGHSLEIGRLLLEFGANVHATASRGGNALQDAICSSRWEEHSEILEQKLSLPIKAGVDVNHYDEDGCSPSDYARIFERWDEWCRALESNGLNIDDVVQADEERRRAFEEQKAEELVEETEEGMEEGTE